MNYLNFVFILVDFLENGLDLRVGWCSNKGYFVGKMAMVNITQCTFSYKINSTF